MAKVAGNAIPVVQFGWAGSDRETRSSGNRHNKVLLKGGQRGKYSPLPDAEWVAIQHCWLLLTPLKDNLSRHPISELSFHANEIAIMSLSEGHDALCWAVKGFNDLFQIGDLNPARVVHRAL